MTGEATIGTIVGNYIKYIQQANALEFALADMLRTMGREIPLVARATAIPAFLLENPPEIYAPDSEMAQVRKLLSEPSAQEIIVSQHLLWGRDKTNVFHKSFWQSMAPAEYGIKFEADELIPALSDVLSVAAGHTVDAGTLTPQQAQAILDTYAQKKAEEKSGTQSGVRIVAAGAKASGKNPCDEICEIACDCMNDRQGAQTLTRCVENELRKRYYDPENGTFPDGTARYPSTPESDGPRPEVSYDPNVPNGYIPRNSSRNPGMPSSHYPYTGMPRPDISWWKDGKLWKIFELKFPRAGGGVDGQTKMQRNGEYRKIAKKQGLNPKKDVIELDIAEDCTCFKNGGGESKSDKCEGLKT